MTEKKEPKYCDLKDYPNLKKFDEYYKDEKNIKKLNIFYKKPNIDSQKYQIDFDTFDKKYHLNKYSKQSADKTEVQNNDNISNIDMKNLGVSKKYDFSKISQEDLNYYLLLVNYYHEKVYGGNIFVKGVNGPIEKALELLKQCQYNTKLALAKILYPVMDRMGGLEEFKNPSAMNNVIDSSAIKNLVLDKNINLKNEKNNNSKNNNEIQQKKLVKNNSLIYLTFALNDLIGADKTQKENWLNYIIEQVNNKIDYKNLKVLIEIANKMRLELPEDINKEINNSEKLCKRIKNELNSKEIALEELKSLYGITQTQKVQTEDFHNLKKIIEQGEEWEKNVKNIIDKIVEYKELESLYNETKTLPFELDEDLFKELKDRYIKAQEWLVKYNSLPKISKSKNSNNKYGEHKIENLDILKEMIKKANEEIKFTSNEVKLLAKNYEFLKETEKEINETLNDKTKKLTKEMLKNFIGKLNESKFITKLHDKLEEELNIVEWRENLIEYINNSNNSNMMQIEESDENLNEKYIQSIFSSDKILVMKNKSFKFLIKEAESKKLLSFPEVKQFVDNDKKITTWIEKIKPIFYSEKQKEKYEINEIMNFNEFLLLYKEGIKFNLINEECEELLNKCRELKNLFDEIKITLNTNDLNNNILDFEKLKSFEEKITIYNITCSEFDLVLNQLNEGKKWKENAKKFIDEYNKSLKNKFKFHYLQKNIIDIDINGNISEYDTKNFLINRNENIKSVEKYLKENKIFYNDLKLLTDNIPPYFKNSSENAELSRYLYLTESKMNKQSKLENTEEILNYIENIQEYCFSKEILQNYFNAYRIKTWNQAIKLKLDLSQAELLFKEGEILKNVEMNEIIDEKIEENDINILGNKISIMKEWINKTKNYLMKKEKTIEELISKINEINNLPLSSGTIDELIEFKNIIEKNINDIKELKNEKKDFNTVIKLYKNFNNHKFIDCPEQTYIKYLYDFGMKWTESAKKIINSRQLCQLYFKNKVPKKDGTFSEEGQNLIDVLSGQSNENMLIEPKFNMNEKISENNNNKDKNTFLAKKRNNDHNDLNKEEGKDKEKNKNVNNNGHYIHKEVIKSIYRDNNGDLIEIKEVIEHFEPNDNNENENDNNNIFDEMEENIEYNPSENVKKYYLNQPLQKYEAANLLSLINNIFNPIQNPQQEQNTKLNHFTRSHNNQNNINNDQKNQINNQTSKNQQINPQLNREENVTQEQIQKFISMNYYERYMFLKSNLPFIDDNGEQYCICRKGDDTINYMIRCELCEEWFHGKCLGMPKPLADNIEHYYCLCCSRRFDLQKESYHKQFFEIKRISLNELVLMIEEGKKTNCIFEEMEILEDIKLRSEIWNKKYYKLLDRICDIFKNENNKYLDSETEIDLKNLYLESESIQISLSSFSHVINILKHNDWLKKVNNEFNTNKKSEENIRNLIKSAYWIFNLYEYKSFEFPNMEKKYLENIYQLAEKNLGILLDLYEIYKPNGGGDNSPSVKDKNKKK